MRRVVTELPFELNTAQKVEAGRPYCMTEGALISAVRACDGMLEAQRADLPLFDPRRDWNDRRLLVTRMGGAGDWLFITPTLREIRRRWPRCVIHVHIGGPYAWLMRGHPLADAVHVPFMPWDEAAAYDGHLIFENIIEYHPLAKTHHAIDLFAAVAGLELSDRTPVFTVPEGLVPAMQQRFPAPALRVGLQLQASGAVRDYPAPLFLQVAQGLLQAGFQVALLGAPGSLRVQTAHPLLLDLTSQHPALSWQESVAFLKTCALVIGPDSSAIHFAAVQDVPALGLYGPFPARLRLLGRAQAIEAAGACAPCFHHGRQAQAWPANGPCQQTKRCEVLASIPPAQIIETALRILRPATV